MKLNPFTLLITAFVFCSSLSAQTDFKKVEKDLNTLLKTTQAPGFAVAVVKGKEVLYAKGFGYANLETKQLVDANTIFPIGSTSKAFTTALLGILEGEKKTLF